MFIFNIFIISEMLAFHFSLSGSCLNKIQGTQYCCHIPLHHCNTHTPQMQKATFSNILNKNQH